MTIVPSSPRFNCASIRKEPLSFLLEVFVDFHERKPLERFDTGTRIARDTDDDIKQHSDSMDVFSYIHIR